MIERATMLGIYRDAQRGRTRPVLAQCARADGTIVDLFCKLSVGCEEGVIHLAKEAVAAGLAADLGLPVPQPFLVEIPSDLYRDPPDQATAERLRRSAAVAFGSRRLPNQFQLWQRTGPVSAAMLPVAQAVFLFDAIIQNPDRSEDNPNCLRRGDEIRIIDHELAFPHVWLADGRKPWEPGGLDQLAAPGRHIFFRHLKGKWPTETGLLRAAWTNLSPERLEEYKNLVLAAWDESLPLVDKALAQIRQAQDRLDECLWQVERVLA